MALFWDKSSFRRESEPSVCLTIRGSLQQQTEEPRERLVNLSSAAESSNAIETDSEAEDLSSQRDLPSMVASLRNMNESDPDLSSAFYHSHATPDDEQPEEEAEEAEDEEVEETDDEGGGRGGERRGERDERVKDEPGFGRPPKSIYDWHLKLDDKGKYVLEWRVEYNENRIIFAMNINRELSGGGGGGGEPVFRPGKDIFGLGFSQNQWLASSDFCIVWYDLAHRIHLQDAALDSQHRLRLIDGSRSFCNLISVESQPLRASRAEIAAPASAPGQVDEPPEAARIVFERPLDVCSAARSLDYYHIDNGTTHLVWFAIRGPVLSLDGLDLSPGQQRLQLEWGLRRVQLVAARPARASGGRRWGGASLASRRKAGSARNARQDIRMSNYEIPARETTYWCKLFRLPHRFSRRKFHITSYGPVIEPRSNSRFVHHMELFHCDWKRELELERLHRSGGWSGECSSRARPPETLGCRRVILAWAMGAKRLVYPEQVGQAVGGGARHRYSSFLVLEVHYNNPGLSARANDSSGLQFRYTSRLRRHEAGVLEVGLEYGDKNSIPPGLVAPLSGYCSGECTRAAMSVAAAAAAAAAAAPTGQRRPPGIHIFAGQMHTHLAGIAGWTELLRAGKLVGELQRDDHYSPHFQEIRLFERPVKLEPGDALIHHCLYDTRARANITLGGFATTDEMCVTYLHYYPRIDLEVCKSSVNSQALDDYFRYLRDEESERTRPAGPVSDNYRAIRWSHRRAAQLLQFYQQAPLDIQCNRSDGQRLPGRWTGAAPIGPPAPQPWLPDGGRARGPPTGLLEYRGAGYRRRHAQCARLEARLRTG